MELRSLPGLAGSLSLRGSIVFPYRYTGQGVNWNPIHVFELNFAIDVGKGKVLTAVRLPAVQRDREGEGASNHVFAHT